MKGEIQICINVSQVLEIPVFELQRWNYTQENLTPPLYQSHVLGRKDNLETSYLFPSLSAAVDTFSHIPPKVALYQEERHLLS